MKVTVAGVVSDYIHYDPLVNIHVSNRSDVHLYPEIKRKLYSALSEGDEGELSIGLSADMVARQVRLIPSFDVNWGYVACAKLLMSLFRMLAGTGLQQQRSARWHGADRSGLVYCSNRLHRAQPP